ncbi:alpha-1,2-mannosyltransferase [Asanoa hainanensis]|uniref:Alpha-1,2-mannosyltransferase n=1 Tax=Asanoa hainanensis TaxID=560556 RepID=A0A239PFY5_9ACTN|nr:glycosyltransferase 87 family protein [Asanoa hainanensis]SNT65941.1 alpha-1,2-mannosyltransferase [Asanoa hainanensis]
MTASRRSLALLALLAVLWVLLVPGRRGFFDVGVYYGAVQHWVGGGDLYDYLRPGTVYGFTYPPFAAMLMTPLAPLSWHTAIAVSIVLNVVAGGLVIRWLVGCLGRPWLLVALLCVFLAPVRDTVSFGQVNLVLLALVWWDLRRGPRAGVGIGIATAVKLTPGLFVLYLALARQWRAFLIAVSTVAGAILLAAAIAPSASRTFWTEALWNTGRVGDLSYVSNQSLRGVLARADLPGWSWALLVLAVCALWMVRAGRAARAGDHTTGFALTGVATCLVSPVTWVHHLVWLLPALYLAWRSGRARILVIAAYVLLCTSAVWLWSDGGRSLAAVLGSNLYVWIALALLAFLPITPHNPAPLLEQHQPQEKDLVAG